MPSGRPSPPYGAPAPAQAPLPPRRRWARQWSWHPELRSLPLVHRFSDWCVRRPSISRVRRPLSTLSERCPANTPSPLSDVRRFLNGQRRFWRRLARAPEAAAGRPVGRHLPGIAELPSAVRRATRRHRSATGALPKMHFDHAALQVAHRRVRNFLGPTQAEQRSWLGRHLWRPHTTRVGSGGVPDSVCEM